MDHGADARDWWKMKDEYVCKMASLQEMNRKWNYEIAHHPDDRENWVIWKGKNIERFQRGDIIPYYGILDGGIICEATAMIHPEAVQNSAGLVGDGAVYLSAFRTVASYQGQGYFSALMRWMLDDLRHRGFTKATLGVEPSEERNKQIYAHYGFTEYIKSATETYPDGMVIHVEYYGRKI